MTKTQMADNQASRAIAAGFGIGFVPFAAGTVASAAAVAVGAVLLLLSPVALACAALLATAGGYLAIKQADVKGDPGWVVIDEFAGQWIALLALPRPTALGLLLAFLLFRVLDIAKPGPVGWADRQHGAFGIMADDVIAGVLAAALLLIVEVIRPRLLM
jgi:phosphatidylglycerophosphatase A